MQIGQYKLNNNLILAPMAGVTDQPFRKLCKQFGAGMAVSEMVASNPALRNHKRTLQKTNHSGELGPISVQILGTDPKQMADAARFNVDRGAQIIDINMGCPAKKVCSVAAGSALLKNEPLVQNILQAVTKAVDCPVTLKIRTGWDMNNRNAIQIAKIAEQEGISALTIHGRTRACGFKNTVEYETIREVKRSISTPVIANGDIDSAEKVKLVSQYTGADAIMIGRAAQGKPWIFKEIQEFLDTGNKSPPPSISEIQNIIMTHLDSLYSFYGSASGVRIARKHIGWYFKSITGISVGTKKIIYQATDPDEQVALVNKVFQQNKLGHTE
jgi:tRNA-dihydrouridine synthase B